MDFHCQYYRKRISLSFTGELFSRRKKRTFLLNSAARNNLLCCRRTTLPSFCARKRAPGKPFATQPERRKKNQTTHVRTHRPETLHRLPRLSRTRRAQFCRHCFADPSFRLPTASLTPLLSGFIYPASPSSCACPDARTNHPAPAAGHSPVRRSTRAARPFWAGAPPRWGLPAHSPRIFPHGTSTTGLSSPAAPLNTAALIVSSAVLFSMHLSSDLDRPSPPC